MGFYVSKRIIGRGLHILSPFSLWYLTLQMGFLKCYGTSLIVLKSQLQYSTEIEKRKENRLSLALGQIIRFITLMTNVLWGFYVSKRIIGRGLDSVEMIPSTTMVGD